MAGLGLRQAGKERNRPWVRGPRRAAEAEKWRSRLAMLHVGEKEKKIASWRACVTASCGRKKQQAWAFARAGQADLGAWATAGGGNSRPGPVLCLAAGLLLLGLAVWATGALQWAYFGPKKNKEPK